MSERPTPRSIGVCALIALRSDPSSPFHEIELSEVEQSRLSTLLEEAVFSFEGSDPGSVQSSAVSHSIPAGGKGAFNEASSSLSSWLSHLCRTVGQELTDLVMDTLDMASESVDSLVDLMESLRVALAEGLVDLVSVHGVYLRQICLGFEELSFESITFLWKSLNEELEQSNETLSMEIDKTSSCEQNASVDGFGDQVDESGIEERWPLSPEQVSEMLRQHCLENRQGSLFHQSFEAVELRVRKILEKNSDIPSAYFLRFLNCLHHGERVGAFESLHQFFDHALVKTSAPKEIIQFSAILLAIAHSTFGDQRLSLMATEEAVRVAQQSNDASCVAFALGWLFESEGQGTSERRELLKRCAARAGKGDIRSLVAGSNLLLARHYLRDNERNPGMIWNTLVAATAEPSTDGLSTLDRSTFLTEDPRDTMNNLSRQAFVAAGVWDEFGMPALSGLVSLATLASHKSLSTKEVAIAVQNVTRLSSHGITLPGSAESIQPMEGVPVSHYSKSISALLEARGRYNLDDKRYDVEFIPTLSALLYDRAVNQGDDTGCQALELVFESSLLPSINEQSTLRARVSLQKCRLLCRQKDWANARATAEEVLRESVATGSVGQKARALVELATVELESTPNHVYTALPPLLEALDICEHSKNFGVHAIGLTVLSRVFLRLQHPKRSIAILGAAIPMLYQSEEIWNRGEAYLTLAKAHIQLGKVASGSPSQRHLQNAVKHLKVSEQMFEECEDKARLREVLYLQARSFSCLGLQEACEEASKRFLSNTTLPPQPKATSSARIGALQPLVTSTNRRT